MVGIEVLDPAVRYMATRGISEATVLEYGVHHVAYRNAIAFPYFDALGRQQGVRFRNLDPELEAIQKYVSEKGSHTRLYNVIALREPEVWICEGEIDTLTLVEHGRAAVGVPGAMNFREAWRWLFVDKRVHLVLDQDPAKMWGDGKEHHAGQEGAEKVSRILRGIADDVDILTLPEGSDVNSLHVDGTLREHL